MAGREKFARFPIQCNDVMVILNQRPVVALKEKEDEK